MGEGKGGGWGRGTGVILGEILTGTEKPTTGIGNFFLISTFSTTFFYCWPHKYKYRYKIKAIYGPMIYTAPYVMLLMRTNPLTGQVGGG
jgi:hypothetical protein